MNSRDQQESHGPRSQPTALQLLTYQPDPLSSPGPLCERQERNQGPKTRLLLVSTWEMIAISAYLKNEKKLKPPPCHQWT